MGETMDGHAVETPTRLGVRGERRGQPRVATTAAAAGAFVVFSGAMTIAFDASGGGDDLGDTSTTPGTVISLVVLVAGYALLAFQKRGPLATGGLVAFAIAVPFFFGFATFSETRFPPWSIDAILGLSTLVWIVAYAVGPSRGRPFLLGAGLLGAWLFLLEQVTNIFSAPFTFLEPFFLSPIGGGSEAFTVDRFDGPDPTEIAVVCAFVAGIYFVGSHLLERRGQHGVATPMVAIGHVAAIVAIFTFTDDLEEIGTGLLAVGVGVLMLYRGATSARRATTWLGGAYLAGGLQSIVVGVTDSATGGGVLLIGCGAVVVILAAFFASASGEPSDDEPGPSFPDGWRRPERVVVGPHGVVVADLPPTGPSGLGAGSGDDDAALWGPPTTDEPPRAGWWKASDDNWYPPEQHPDARGG
jgi:hypothetical protein